MQSVLIVDNLLDLYIVQSLSTIGVLKTDETDEHTLSTILAPPEHKQGIEAVRIDILDTYIS